MAYRLSINGQAHDVEVEPQTPLLWVLRDSLGLVGTKYGCGQGLCGACTVHIDGQTARACVLPVEAVGAASVTTIEGLHQSATGRRLQDAWIAHDVPQCGYCQAGQLMTAAALLAERPHPTLADIGAAMEGNLCRCATYDRVRAAIVAAAK